MNTHYTLLGIPPTAPPDEVKRAFRREVARYHPDKVQHLGPEFQELATSRSAALTEAYRVLTDAELRREYDEQLAATPEMPDLKVGRTPGEGASRRTDLEVAHTPPEVHATAAVHSAASLELVKRAVLLNVRDAVFAQAGTPSVAAGFDAAYQLKGRKGLFRGSEPSVRIVVRLVPIVDAACAEACWPAALRLGWTGDVVCVLMLGSEMASSRELADAVAALRRKSRGIPPVLIPVDIRDWHALVPPETPAAVRTLLARLRNND